MRPLGRPEGLTDSNPATRKANVGDGHEPLAGVRILKGRSLDHARPSLDGSISKAIIKPATAATPSVVSQSVTAKGLAEASLLASRRGDLENTASDIAKALHLPVDVDTFLALSALLGEKLGLHADAALAMRRFIKRHDGDPAAARVAARALASGMDPEGVEAERLMHIIENLSGDDDGFGSSAGGSGGKSSGGSQDDGQPGRDAPHEKCVETTSAEITGIAEILSGTLQQVRAVDGMGMLCNVDGKKLNESGTSGYWVCVPFEVQVHDVDFHGFLRIWYDGKVAWASRLVADIRCGDERRLMSLHGEGSNAKICYHADSLSEQDAFVAEFGKRWKVSSLSMLEGDLAELGEIPGIDADA